MVFADSTPIATTHLNTTTPTILPTTVVTSKFLEIKTGVDYSVIYFPLKDFTSRIMIFPDSIPVPTTHMNSSTLTISSTTIFYSRFLQ